MSENFAFIKSVWPQIYADCAKAEQYYALGDPTASVIFARRVTEQLVKHIYRVEDLGPAYRNDLAARLGEAKFSRIVGSDFVNKATLLRKDGNAGAHPGTVVRPRTALRSLQLAHDLVVFTAFRFSTTPDAVPTAAEFDEALIPTPSAESGQQPPLSTDELQALLAQFEAKDAAIADAERVNADLQAEIDRLRADVAQAQSQKVHTVDRHDYREAQTRSDLIDKYLAEAGWDLADSRDREYHVTGMPAGKDGYVDYVLWGDDGLPLAVVEAKRAHKDSSHGQEQARLYADCLERETGQRPIIFYTNGFEHWLWDDAAGYPPRRVHGFYAKDELALAIRRRVDRAPLSRAPVQRSIVERDYQERAIKAVGAAFDAHQRDALLVMATGSGKTRTTIALVKQLMDQGWAKRVLFLADRQALVTQAARAFRTFLPSATTVNLLDEKSADGRIYVATYPTMMNLIDRTEDERRLFGPGYFDLVVIDEAHRSVYKKYGAIFDYFDSLLLGLTATPKDEIDRNTYSLFHLENGVPTDAYDLDQAVEEGYLVPPRTVAVPLKFPRQGVRYDELSEDEKDEWDALDWSDDDAPAPVAVSAGDVNRYLFNVDTVDKLLTTLMTEGRKVAGGDRLGKTVIFARSMNHAAFVKERFDLSYPEYGGAFAKVIVSADDHAQSLIDQFAEGDKAPHIAISVDMLDTGIDVPEIVNLVLFKPVFSKSKFWQMLGRGTRLCPDLFAPGVDKGDFLVLDACGNLEFFQQDIPEPGGSVQKSLAERLFEARLQLVTAIDAGGSRHGPAETDGTKSVAGLRVDTAHLLHDIVVAMNPDNFVVRSRRRWVERYNDWTRWDRLTAESASEIAEHLAGLPSARRDDDEQAKRFDLVILRGQLARLEQDALAFEQSRRQTQDIATALLDRMTIASVAAERELLDDVASDEWWVDVTLPMLESARRRLRPLVRLIERQSKSPVYTDFEDELGELTEISLSRSTGGTDWERFRAKARAFAREHEDHVAMQRLKRNKQLTPDDLISLERMFLDAGVGTAEHVERAGAEAGGFGLFVRSLVGLDRGAASEAFAAFLAVNNCNVEQIRFIDTVIEHLSANGVIDVDRLYEAPFTDRAPLGPDSLFEDAQVTELERALDDVRAHATVEGDTVA